MYIFITVVSLLIILACCVLAVVCYQKNLYKHPNFNKLLECMSSKETCKPDPEKAVHYMVQDELDNILFQQPEMTTSPQLAPVAATTVSATTSDSPPPLPPECGMTTVDIEPEHSVVITPVDVPVAHSPALECHSASAPPSFASSSSKPYHFHGFQH